MEVTSNLGLEKREWRKREGCSRQKGQKSWCVLGSEHGHVAKARAIWGQGVHVRGPAGEGNNAMPRDVAFTYPKSSNRRTSAAPCIWDTVLVHICISPAPIPA